MAERLYRCKTCRSLFAPDESVRMSREFCSPACRDEWSAYRKRLKGFDERMRKYLDGRQEKRPSRPKDLRIPDLEERLRSRVEELRRIEEEVNAPPAPRGRPRKDGPATVVYENGSYRKVYSRKCHECGRPCNNYWCTDCWRKRKKKYHITENNAWAGGADDD